MKNLKMLLGRFVDEMKLKRVGTKSSDEADG